MAIKRPINTSLNGLASSSLSSLSCGSLSMCVSMTTVEVTRVFVWLNGGRVGGFFLHGRLALLPTGRKFQDSSHQRTGRPAEMHTSGFRQTEQRRRSETAGATRAPSHLVAANKDTNRTWTAVCLRSECSSRASWRDILPRPRKQPASCFCVQLKLRLVRKDALFKATTTLVNLCVW